MIDFVVGMMLLCNFYFDGINSYRVRLSNVPTKVIAITSDKTHIVLEHDLTNIPNFKVLSSSNQKVIDVVPRAAVVDDNYLNCKERK